ncbi:MAG TPA: hypothetical protein VKV26_02600 [Dehalococcoidia bacterium]|nr:hypothetical protein [Dehalococcoidia bacterium]
MTTTMSPARPVVGSERDGYRRAGHRRPSARKDRGGADSPAHTTAGRIVTRRQAALALDPTVRALLPRLSARLLVMQPSLTIYDTIWPATPEAGACWTLTARIFGPVMHIVCSYAVTLCFDAEDRPHHFIVSGATLAVSEDASGPALARAIAAARRAGPLCTASPNVQPFAL